MCVYGVCMCVYVCVWCVYVCVWCVYVCVWCVYVCVWCVLAQNNELSIRGATAVVFVLGLLFACSHYFGVFVFLLCLFAQSLMSCYTVAIVFRGFVNVMLYCSYCIQRLC